MGRTIIADPSFIPDIEAFEERVAIMVYEGGIPTEEAKDLAAQAQGFCNQAHYWVWLMVYVKRTSLRSPDPEAKMAQPLKGVGFRVIQNTNIGLHWRNVII